MSEKQKLKSGRVLLGPAAVRDLLEMEAEIASGEKFLKLNPSLLASWIICRYRKSAFANAKEKAAIKLAHFDHRKRLRASLKGAGSREQLKDALSAAIKGLGGRAGSKRGKRQNKGQQAVSGGDNI